MGDCGIVNPFLDRPASANGQEKVSLNDGLEGGLSPFRGRVAAGRPADV
jgi:hypothetical protein